MNQRQPDWKNVTFSEKKHLKLGGPDGFNWYFHDPMKAKDIKWSKNFIGAIPQGAASANNKTDLVVESDTMNNEVHIKILNVQLSA